MAHYFLAFSFILGSNLFSVRAALFLLVLRYGVYKARRHGAAHKCKQQQLKVSIRKV
jgi:hypothetical protein